MYTWFSACRVVVVGVYKVPRSTHMIPEAAMTVSSLVLGMSESISSTNPTQRQSHWPMAQSPEGQCELSLPTFQGRDHRIPYMLSYLIPLLLVDIKPCNMSQLDFPTFPLINYISFALV